MKTKCLLFAVIAIAAAAVLALLRLLPKEETGTELSSSQASSSLSVPASPSSLSSSSTFQASSTISQKEPPPSSGAAYIRGLARQTAQRLVQPGMTGEEKIQAAYEDLIARTFFAQPVGLDIWQVRGGGEAPSYLENRALSPLAFGIGSCEDSAAALCLVLEEMGFEPLYVPGLTVSVYGDFVDHAWCMVQLDGVWYHLDPQLEDNVIRNDLLTYRYFLRCDQTMLADHRWGENLLTFAALTPEQVQEVEEHWLTPACPTDRPTPAPKELRQAPQPDRARLEVELEQERQRYEAEYGPIPECELQVIPPVFGWEGYGPKDD